MTTSSNNHLIRILLIDDQAIVREGLRMLLESHPGIVVVGEASDCQQAVALVKQSQPDVILLDLDLGNAGGHDCLEELANLSPESRVLVLTGLYDLDLHQAAISRGAMGLVRKLEAAEVLVKAIKKVYAGEVWLDGALMARLLEELWRERERESSNTAYSSPNSERRITQGAQSQTIQVSPEERVKMALLTDREREVVTLIGEGLRNQQIADRLCISVITVRHHLSSIFSKLGVSDRFELAIYAYRNGLAKLPL
ncbi:MAG: response regulator transcription factor [Blastocatellia bacterium]